MPSVLSKELAAKILGREWSFGYNCYEVGHTWTPSCTEAALELSTAAGLKIVPLYTVLYTFSQLVVQRKFDLPASLDTINSIARSSFFIFFHAYNGSLMGCALRHSFGRFYYRVLICAPALISSYISLIIERPARRQALAFYVLNLASEIVYRMAITKGYFKPLSHGETLLFALSLSAWYYLIKKHGFGHDPVSAMIKVLIGRAEAKSRAATTSKRLQALKQQQQQQQQDLMPIEDEDEKSSSSTTTAKIEPQSSKQNKQLTWMRRLINSAGASLSVNILPNWLIGRHCSCPHSKSSCLHYILSPIPTRWLFGWFIQTLLKLSNQPKLFLTDPKKAFKLAATAKISYQFGLFISILVSSGRLTSCILRYYSNSNEHAWHAAVAGFIAGLSMLLAPRSSLSMYIMWKAVEQYYLLANRQGKVRYFNFTIMSIYAASTATILYAFALEPKYVRPSYMKFLDNMSNHRLHQLNRMVLDVFGTGSSVGYENYFPDLDPKYMSNQFKELVFNWMIQPYE